MLTSTFANLGNRRGGVRIPLDTQVPYAVDGEQVHYAHGLNVSRTGARLILRGEHSTLLRTLTLQVAGMEIRGRVVWEEKMDRGHCRVAGVRFERLTASQRRVLESLTAPRQQAA